MVESAVGSTMVDSREYAFEGATPDVHETAHVSREAVLVGDVTIEADASVWPGAVLRGDLGPVRIGVGAHVGDNATVHASRIDAEAMIGHGAVVNDARVRRRSLVGFNAIVNTGVTVGEGSIVAAGTAIPEGRDVPDGSFVRGVPARITPLSETTVDPEAIFERYASGDYTDLARRHGPLFE